MLCILARGCGEVWARSGPGLVLRTGQTGSIFPANTILEAAGEMGFGKAFGEGSSRQSFGFCFAFFFLVVVLVCSFRFRLTPPCLGKHGFCSTRGGVRGSNGESGWW